MHKRKCHKNKIQTVNCENSNISQEKMIEIQAEAYYRALKRIENEKSGGDKKIPEKKKHKWCDNVLFGLNVLFWPWKINKRFSVSNRIYDNLLVLFVSGALQFIGGIIWLIGIVAFVCEIYQMIKNGVTSDLINGCPIIMLLLLFGSTFVLAGEEFGKETDSNKIYAYSASVIALISCVVGIIALFKV